jgi:hypothetical protein
VYFRAFSKRAVEHHREVQVVHLVAVGVAELVHERGHRVGKSNDDFFVFAQQPDGFPRHLPGLDAEQQLADDVVGFVEKRRVGHPAFFGALALFGLFAAAGQGLAHGLQIRLDDLLLKLNDVVHQADDGVVNHPVFLVIVGQEVVLHPDALETALAAQHLSRGDQLAGDDLLQGHTAAGKHLFQFGRLDVGVTDRRFFGVHGHVVRSFGEGGRQVTAALGIGQQPFADKITGGAFAARGVVGFVQNHHGALREGGDVFGFEIGGRGFGLGLFAQLFLAFPVGGQLRIGQHGKVVTRRQGVFVGDQVAQFAHAFGQELPVAPPLVDLDDGFAVQRDLQGGIAVAVEDERHQVHAADVVQVAVDVGKEGGFFGDEDGRQPVFGPVADDGRRDPALADAGLVADDHAVAALDVPDGQGDGVHLLGGKELEYVGFERIMQFLGHIQVGTADFLPQAQVGPGGFGRPCYRAGRLRGKWRGRWGGRRRGRGRGRGWRVPGFLRGWSWG